MPSNYRSFAIWGAGNLEKPLVIELLKHKSTGDIDSVTVLTRPVCDIESQDPLMVLDY
jgi:hypothetical protein